MSHKNTNTKLCKITGSHICRCDKKLQQSSQSHNVNHNINHDVNHDIKTLFRKLFTDHAVYTKFYIESVLNNALDTSSIGNRLFANQDEIGLNVGKIIGADNGAKLTALLREHIQFAAATLVAAKNKQDIEAPKAKLFGNSKRVSVFLSGLNPNLLPYSVVKQHFDQHNTYVLEMVILHLGNKFDEEVIVYDQYYNHMLMFSDLLANALIDGSDQNNKIFGYDVSYLLFYGFVILLLLMILYKECYIRQ